MKCLLLPLSCILSLLVLPSCTSTPTPAQAAPAAAVSAVPSDESIRELLAVAEAPALIDGMLAQVEGSIQNGIKQALGDRPVTPAKQAAIDKYTAKGAAIIREEMTWAKLEPIYLRIYKEALTQSEVDGMIAFYKTPAGRAVVKKLPTLMQQIMTELPAMIGPMMQKIQAAAQEFGNDLQVASKADKATE
jgi:hypothetical protein